ncbi:MAG TPA: SdiA-regulated domain-containing protein [Ignavibacteriaceae bacterium]|nr:SdiA-regulated domain-containing protein [Ignavibacteriaceae bacterium]
MNLITRLFILLIIPLFQKVIFCQHLSSYDFSKSPDQFKLSSELREISGLTIKGNKLFTHEDEKGNIYQIDPATGNIIKKFRLGKKAVHNDFEGIAAAGKKLFLISSKGEIYLFYEQKNNTYSKYTKINTPLSGKNDVEGLCFDPSTYSLLIACKGDPGKDYEGFKAVYSFDIASRKLNNKPRFLISLDELQKQFGIKRFSPSGIERDPKTGSFFVLSSNEKYIVEISPEGKLIYAVKLKHKYHNQPEGIAITSDSQIFISDEGGKGEGTLSKYYLK